MEADRVIDTICSNGLVLKYLRHQTQTDSLTENNQTSIEVWSWICNCIYVKSWDVITRSSTSVQLNSRWSYAGLSIAYYKNYKIIDRIFSWTMLLRFKIAPDFMSQSFISSIALFRYNKPSYLHFLVYRWSFPATIMAPVRHMKIQATGLDARASRVKWPAQFMSHWYGILFTD